MKNYINSNCIKAGIFFIFLLFIFLNIESGFANNGCKQKLDSLHILLSESTTQKSKAGYYSDIARCYYTSDDIPLAIKNYKIAASIYLKEKMYSQYCYQLEALGVMYMICNNTKTGLHYLFEALKTVRQHNLSKNQEYALMQNIGILYNEAEEWKKGIAILKKCEQYFSSDSCKQKGYHIVSLINIGYAYNNTHQYDSALSYFNKAFHVSTLYKIDTYTGGIYQNLGDLYINLNEYGKAKQHYLQSLKLISHTKDSKSYYRSLYGLGTAESGSKKYDVAIPLILESINHFNKTRDYHYAKNAYKHLYKIYESKGDIKNLVKYQKLYEETKDSIYAINLNRELTEIQMQFELEKIENEHKMNIAFLEKDKKLNNYRWYLITSLLLLLTTILITLNTRHITKEKLAREKLRSAELEQKQLENEINYKKRDIENLALHIVQKNEFLEQIKSDIKTLKDDIKPENQTKLKSISLKIAQSARKNKELEKLQENIDKINWVFIDKLTERFPELTEKEKRLCTLLKLNFNSKEIANLNNVSEDAVIKARHRMRKKMGLGPDENLTEFIHRI